MFDIFIKRSEVVLDCFTTDKNNFDFFSPKKASYFIPQWWKNIPNNETAPNKFVGFKPQNTMKNCPGFLNYYKKGIIIPLWSDMIITTNTETYSYQFADELSVIEQHAAEQYNFSIDLIHLKIVSPWFLKSKKGVNFLMSSPYWNHITNHNVTTNFFVTPGITDFYYQHGTHVNVFVTKKINRFEFQANNPLLHLTPLTEKNIKIKTHLIDEFEHKKLFFTSLFSFKKLYDQRKKLSDQCPFK